MNRATYLYCVAHGTRRPSLGRVPAGLPDAAPPSLLEVAPSMWLVAADVPLDRYGPDRLESALRDLEWVAAIAVAHEAVVEHVARLRGVTVVPMKLFTMFSNAGRAVEEMRGRRREIAAVLKRIGGCEEWGVRVIRGAQAPPPPPAEVTSGAAFLAARKQARDVAREAAMRAAEAAEQAFDGLAPLARSVRRREDAPAGAVPPLLDAAFLVPTGKRARFQTTARRLAQACARAGADLTLTGPWPAYNFVQHAGEARA
jgi:hypothetical protein